MLNYAPTNEEYLTALQDFWKGNALTTIVNATVEDIINSAADFYGVDPIYAQVVAFDASRFNYRQPGGLFNIQTPPPGVTAQELLNPITNAHVAVPGLVGSTPSAADTDLMNSVRNRSYPPGWTTMIGVRTGLSVTIEDAPAPAPQDTALQTAAATVEAPAVSDTPTPAPTDAVITVAIPMAGPTDGAPLEPTVVFDKVRSALTAAGMTITQETSSGEFCTFDVVVP